MIKVEIKLCKDYLTQFQVNNVNEIEDKVKEWHTMSDFERDYYEKKGTLDAQLATGWYFKESTEATEEYTLNEVNK